MSDNAAVTVFVTYPGTPSTRFDRAYYVERHLPLVTQAWTRYGLRGADAFFPAGDGGTIAMAQLRFADAAAVAAALGSPETAGVMADIANFTDATPALARAEPL